MHGARSRAPRREHVLTRRLAGLHTSARSQTRECEASPFALRCPQKRHQTAASSSLSGNITNRAMTVQAKIRPQMSSVLEHGWASDV